MNTNDLVKQLTAKKKPMPNISPDTFLSSGSAIVNCSITNNPFCAFEMGKYYFFVGDSMSGKTYFAMNILAEAAGNDQFDDYSFYHNNKEDGALMDIAKLFGEEVENRIEPPAWVLDKNEDGGEVESHSQTVEEFWLDVKQKCAAGPCIYILDSMDSLTSIAEQKKSKEIMKAIEEDKETTGIMSDGKAKVNSMMVRQILKDLKDSGSILIIIAQTRDNLGTGFAEKTRSGGKSLRFYSTAEIWTSSVKSLKKTYKGVDRKVGSMTRFKIKKNRHTGLESTIDIPLLTGYGFDDMGSCVDFLTKTKHWKKSGNKIIGGDLGIEGTRESLITQIEADEELLELLHTITGEVWNQIIEATTPKRKRRYE